MCIIYYLDSGKIVLKLAAKQSAKLAKLSLAERQWICLFSLGSINYHSKKLENLNLH